ncbi:MAG: DUF4956 domain-containing protein [Clostridiaceae bacterium]|jgi:uncharacterized membrane protein YhiD involved in acid resistance|nr:DUF4956 domain-containing protein [Eubacteriales bacterium]NLV48543.1 DUF4956 domain-containing protein [Clostridiaceae bacterium]
MREAILKLLEVNINQPLTLERILITFAITLIMGSVILLIYRITFRGVMYNRSFGTALLMVSLVTALIIMPISSNVVLSLGMVGALSIVRFRTALKDPLDIVYMFWAIALGLTAGAGFFELAIIGSLILAVIMLIVTSLQSGGRKKPYLLIVRYNDAFRTDLRQILPPYTLKSKTATSQGYEAVLEIRLLSQDAKIVEQLNKAEGVLSVSLVRYSGDYQS